MSAPELKPCPFCRGGETRIDPQGQTWRGTKGYSDPICYRLVHFCKGILPDDYVTNRMELRARTEAQAIEAWNTRATDPRVLALVEAAQHLRALDEDEFEVIVGNCAYYNLRAALCNVKGEG